MKMATGARVSTDAVNVDGPKLGSTVGVDVDADEGLAVGLGYLGATPSGGNEGNRVLGNRVDPTAEGGGSRDGGSEDVEDVAPDHQPAVPAVGAVCVVPARAMRLRAAPLQRGGSPASSL